MHLFVAFVYTLAIIAGFCGLWAYLAMAWGQLRISRSPDWLKEGNAR